MDPASMGIGAFSLLFQMFAGCVDGYNFIADACHAHSDCYALLVKFKLEENRLINWAKLVKLDYTDESLTFNHMSKMLVLDVMEQQRDLLNKFRKLEDKKGYRKLAMTSRTKTAIQHEASPAAALLESGHLTSNSNGPPTLGNAVQFPPIENEEIVKKALLFLKRFQEGMAEVPRRLQWATIHKDKMEELIEKLADLNNKMLEALGQGQMETLISMHKRTDYQILVMNQKFEQFTQIIQSQLLSSSRRQNRITYLEESDYDDLDSQLIPHHRRIEPLGALAQSKALHQAIEGSTVIDYEFAETLRLPEPARASAIRETQLSIRDIRAKDGGELQDDDDDSNRTEASYNGTSVWIEWKVAEPSTLSHNGGLDPKIEERVKKLAALLKSNSSADESADSIQFRAPHCLGYFKDEEYSRFGLVFKKPRRASTEPPVSLHALLTDTSVTIPSLTDRILLMRLLAETMERLHAVDWLHKGLRSANILFFNHPNSATINYADPYISGFDYSRPAGRDDMTERPADDLAADLYRHPFVQRQGNKGGFRKMHDLYALGTLLLEIARWKPLAQILDIDLKRAKPKDAYQVRERLLTTDPGLLRDVRSFSGDTVERIIRTCLDGPEAFGLTDDGDGAELQRAFGEQVVARLEHMRGL
ncbi:prion-inhibition and propagation-domain-containing protein [Boeremia exigua]|uniref:prion-inhibition and propagation-domain-containing protein n=1 Tax=Boeremia exigua TaxID=749465 RepID=UPI001E8E6677|nr:prion-inhibition and propagation-domain-containing protein [Boeremia exigua]KAH6616675.1 prion-inhibition and propagation-domain-containing protein [Boeremia exigua]